MTDHDLGFEDERGSEIDDFSGAQPRPADAEARAAADAAAVAEAEAVVEHDVVALLAERDQFKDIALRLQADFENYRKRAAKQVADDSARAVEALVDKLLPVLDACEAAVVHGSQEVGPVHAALLGTLQKEGLERIDPVGEAFDPNRHEAVLHEPAAEGDDGTVVSEVMRAGYGWKGRVVRPAMVKVRG